MKNKFLSLTLITFTVLAFSFNVKAQAPFKYLTHIFSSDSLKGFDEAFYNKMALNDGYFGSEYHVFMYSVKRNFINQKYGFTKGPGFNSTAKGGNNTVYGLPCQNEDFEGSPVGLVTGTLLGWQLAEGQNIYLTPGGSCTMNGCCPTFPSNNAWVMATPVTGDPVMGTIPASPLGGTKILKMNDDITNKGEVVRIQQTFPVTSSNALFQFAYMAALNGTGHTCCSQPYVRITLIDCMNNLIACPQVSITPPGPSCATVSATGWSTNSLGYSYTSSWQVRSLDLTPYMGSCITVQITIGDCDGWAHFGYGYVDCLCLPMTVCVNNICFPAGNPVVAVAACGVTTGTMVAPPGLGPYTWNGPTGSGITNNPNQTVTTTVAGNYTLTMNPIGVCTPITKTVTLTFGTFPNAGFTAINSCTTYSFTNTGTGPPAVQTYSFVGPGPPPSFTTTASTSVVNFAPSTTYTVLQTVTNAAGCPATASMVITTPAGPSPAFTASPSFTQCLTGNAFTFNATTAVGSQTYNFNPTVGSPAPGYTSNYGPVSFTAAGNYTVTHIVVSGGCTVQTQSVCVVNAKPTASASATPPACSGGVATLFGSGGPGNLSWSGPGGFTAFGSPVAINNFTVGNQGVYTLTVNNFGCITTATVNVIMPAAPSVTVTNNGPVCAGQTISLTAVPSSTSISWSYWYNSTFSWYNFSSTLTPTIATSNTITANSSAVYYFYVSWTGGCWATVSTTVQVVITPTVSASNTGPYCPGATVQLNCPTAAGSYTWAGPSSFTSAVQNPTTAAASNAVYTVMIGSGSCTAAATTSVVINPLPTPTVTSNSPVCLGAAINLSVTAATTYTWTGPGGFSSNAQNPIIASSTAASAGVYTVTISNAAGCNSTGTINIVITTPTTSASNTGPYCAGQTIQLNTPAATSYTWTGPSAFASNAQNPTIALSTVAMSGVYTVTSTTGACKATATTNVIVNALPTPTASNTGPYCPGNIIQLNVGAFTTYTWSGPSTFTSNAQNPTQANAQATNAGIYTVTVTNASGCKNTATTNVVVNPTPVVVIGSNSPVCLNNPINLTSSGGTGYSWSGPNAFTSATQNPTIPVATSANAGVYTVTVTSLGCTNTGTVSVTVLSPTTSASNTGPYCAGATIQLNTPAATSYTWTGPSAFASNAQNPTITNASIGMSGTYSVLVSAGSCTAFATTNIVVNPLPVPAASNTGPYCPGNTIQLNVGPFTSYSWTGPSAFSSTVQNATQLNAQTTNSGNYIVTVTDANGCKNTATTNVVVNPTPIVVIGSNSPVCINNAINLTSSGGTGYSWSGPSAFTSALQNPTIPAATAVNSGVYTVTVTALGCTNTGTVNVTVTTPTTSAANTGPYCAGSTMQLNAPASTSYTWSGPGGFTSNAQNPTGPGVTLAMAGTYSVIVSIGTCTANATTNVVVNALPIPVPANTGAYCPGNTIQLNVGAFITYTWTGPSAFTSNSQNPTVTSAAVVNSGPYTVTVTDANGCINTAVTNVVVNPNPIPVLGSNSPVCINNAINLTATGGSTYSWSGPNAFTSASQNPTIPNATGLQAGVYSVTVTSAAGCTATANINVIVTTPTTSVSNTGPYCAGTTINLSAPAASSYTWSGPGGFTSNTQNATQLNSTTLMSGTYSVIVSIGSCTANASTNVVVNALPTPNALATTPVCVGAAINLTGTGGTTYTWTGPASFNSNSATPSIGTSIMGNAGNYVLSVTDANGCINSTNINVVVNALPVIAVNTPTNCVNTTINLTSNGGVTYSWTGPGGFTSNVQNPNIPLAQLAMAGVYVVTVTDANGCINTANTNVSVLPLPNPNIASNSPVCAGGVLTLTGSGGVTYSWSGPGYTGPTQNPVINNVTASANGVYTLLVSSGTCTASTTYTVVINPVPVFNFANTNVLCNGQSNGTSGVNVTVGTGPFTYQWSSIPVQSAQNATALPAGTYSCIVTDANGCTSISSTNITQPTPFSVAITSATLSACAGIPINVIANGSGGTGPYSYNWVSGPSTSPYTVNQSVAGNYIYTVNATDAFNCPATNLINLTFVAQPTVSATSATLCAGQTANLIASGAQTYIWQPGNITGSTYPYSGNTSVNVSVIGTSNGCSNSTNASIIVSPNPNASISASTAKGCVPTCMTFTGSGTTNIVSYSWTLNGIGITGAQAGQYCFSDAATYSLGLSVIDANGCTGIASPFAVNIYPAPIADFNHSPIKPIVNIDQEVTFTDASYNTPIVSWNWYFMNTAQYTSTQQNPTFSYTEPGTYVVALVVKSDKGCYDTLLRPLVVGEDFGIYVPNSFTPNADGLNDVFQPKGFGVVKYELNIFDRWGERVFHTTTFEEGWDGSFQGRGQKICEENSYTWLINCTSVFGKAHELKGHVTLIK